MNISKHFNQTSNKILSLDEFATRQAQIVLRHDEEVNFIKGLLADRCEWKDAAGHLYIREMSIKGFFSNLAGVDIPKYDNDRVIKGVTQEYYPKMQRNMDESEDHTQRLKSGQLFPKNQ